MAAPSHDLPDPVTRPAVSRAARALVPVLDQLSDEELNSFTRLLEQAATPAQGTGTGATLATELSGRRVYTQAERFTLEADALLAFFRHRRHLLDGALTAPQVATLLGTSRQTPHDRAKGGSLLAVMDRGALRFPAWQFDPEGPDGVVAGLPDVLRALHVPPLSRVSWLLRPNPYFNGDSPLAVLKRKEIDRVVAAARAVEAD